MGNSHDFEGDRVRKIKQRDERLAKFMPKFQEILAKQKMSPEKVELVTRMSVEQIIQKLNNRELTSTQLIAIFGLRAATVGKALCVITEDYFEFALAKAEECDTERAKTGKKNWTFGEQWNPQKHFPALFGIPISVKDNIEMKGTVSTVGLTARAFRVNQEDSPYIICMKKTGAIPFIKTNLPQNAMNFDSQNFLWGEAKNPWNTKKSCGGSSGGEGGCLAARISVIGIGNDIGGSLRIPSTFCGTTALMPSQDRLFRIRAFTKYSTGFTGMDSIKAVNGPMSTSVQALALWMKLVTNANNFGDATDPYINLIPFDDQKYLEFQTKKSLRIGYLKNLEFVECTPSSQRAVMETIDFLKQQGHQLVPIKIPNEKEVILSFFTQLAGEGGLQSVRQMMEGEKLSKNYKTFDLVTSLNCCTFGCIKCLLNSSQPRMGQVVQASGKKSTHEYILNKGRIHQLKEEWVKYWLDLKLDALISPGFGSEATNHGFSDEGSLVASYTIIWNILGMTSGSLPTTVVRPDQQKYESIYEDDFTRLMKSTVKDAAELPNGIQVVSLPFKEQQVLGIMKRIESHFQFNKKYPYPNV